MFGAIDLVVVAKSFVKLKGGLIEMGRATTSDCCIAFRSSPSSLRPAEPSVNCTEACEEGDPNACGTTMRDQKRHARPPCATAMRDG